MNNESSSAQATKERAEKGNEILGSRVAQGSPGTKQPAHDSSSLDMNKTVEALTDIVKENEAIPYESSAKRAEQSGNPNPIPPHERHMSRGPAILQQADNATAALGAAKAAMQSQLEADARIVSDPRYENDLKILELGKQGKLGLVQPSEFETALRSDSENAENVAPVSVEEQIADDTRRLEAAESAATSTASPAAIQKAVDKVVGVSDDKSKSPNEVKK